eukprot:EG_transcript_7520
MTLLWGGDFSPLVTAISSKIQHCNSSIRCMHRFPPVKHRAAPPSLGFTALPCLSVIYCAFSLSALPSLPVLCKYQPRAVVLLMTLFFHAPRLRRGVLTAPSRSQLHQNLHCCNCPIPYALLAAPQNTGP